MSDGRGGMPALPPVAVEPDEPLRVRLLRFAGGAVLIVPLPDRVCLVDHLTSAFIQLMKVAAGISDVKASV